MPCPVRAVFPAPAPSARFTARRAVGGLATVTPWCSSAVPAQMVGMGLSSGKQDTTAGSGSGTASCDSTTSVGCLKYTWRRPIAAPSDPPSALRRMSAFDNGTGGTDDTRLSAYGRKPGGGANFSGAPKPEPKPKARLTPPEAVAMQTAGHMGAEVPMNSLWSASRGIPVAKLHVATPHPPV